MTVTSPPETDEHPELYEWTRRLHLMRKWAEMLKKSSIGIGIDIEVQRSDGRRHLPEVLV